MCSAPRGPATRLTTRRDNRRCITGIAVELEGSRGRGCGGDGRHPTPRDTHKARQTQTMEGWGGGESGGLKGGAGAWGPDTRARGRVVGAVHDRSWSFLAVKPVGNHFWHRHDSRCTVNRNNESEKKLDARIPLFEIANICLPVIPKINHSGISRMPITHQRGRGGRGGEWCRDRHLPLLAPNLTIHLAGRRSPLLYRTE